MNQLKITLVGLITILTTACSAPHFKGEPIGSKIQSKGAEIVLIKDTETRDGFREAIEQWLTKNNYKYTVTPDGTKHDLEKLTIEYVGYWKWDLALYLSEARVEAFHQGQRVGQVSYKAPNSLNTNKFSHAEKRIEKMLEVLFGKVTDYEATNSL